MNHKNAVVLRNDAETPFVDSSRVLVHTRDTRSRRVVSTVVMCLVMAGFSVVGSVDSRLSAQSMNPTPTSVSVLSPLSTTTAVSNAGIDRLSDRTIILTVLDSSDEPVEGAQIQVAVRSADGSYRAIINSLSDSSGIASILLDGVVLKEILTERRVSYATNGYDPVFEEITFRIDAIHGVTTGSPTISHHRMSYTLPIPDISRISDKLGVSIAEATTIHNRIVGTGIEESTIHLEPMAPVEDVTMLNSIGHIDSSVDSLAAGNAVSPLQIPAETPLPPCPTNLFNSGSQAVIGGRAWSDDGDGIDEPAEVGVPGVEVFFIGEALRDRKCLSQYAKLVQREPMRSM